MVRKPPRRGARCPGAARPSGLGSTARSRKAPRLTAPSGSSGASARAAAASRRGTRSGSWSTFRPASHAPMRSAFAAGTRAGAAPSRATPAKSSRSGHGRRPTPVASRCKRGSRGWRKAKTMLRLHLERETRARDQHRHKQVHHAAMKADVHVVERNNHATMRRRGGKSKSRMNRSLAEAGPARTVQLLRHQCERHGKRLVEAPAVQLAHVRRVRLARDQAHPRPHRLRGLRTHRRPRRERRGERPQLGTNERGRAGPGRLQPGGFSPARFIPAPRSARCRWKALGPKRPLRGGSQAKLPDQIPNDDGFRHEFCPRPDPQQFRPSGQVSC